ncbi:hypothetical protein Pelo_7173 [Pelomyxa schiedti]|nr:hypothetical protein Pelo_7173 [Pelomyxa schiedti]
MRKHSTSTAGHITHTSAGTGTCRNQFAALLASSLPRCGAASPARLAASNSPLMLSMWRELFAAPSAAEAFVVSARLGPHRGGRGSLVAISLCVSTVTLGVVRGPAVVHSLDRGQQAEKWIGPNEYLWQVYSPSMYSPRKPVPSGVYAFCCPSSGAAATEEEEAEGSVAATPKSGDSGGGGDCLSIQGGGGGGGVLQTFCRLDAGITNSKWVVTWPWESGYFLLIHRVHHSQDNDTSGSGTLEGVRDMIPLGIDARGAIRVALSWSNPDEALILSCKNDKAQFTLLDLPMTYSTGRPVVLVSTTTQWPGEDGVEFVVGLLIMKNGAGQPVFIYTNRRVVYHLDPCTGVKTQLTKLKEGRCCFSQVSSSVFCIGLEETYELWDCNNVVAQPLLRAVHSDKRFRQVVGGRGFLFAVTDNKNEILVIDAMSGVIVLTIVVSSPINMIHPETSFL